MQKPLLPSRASKDLLDDGSVRLAHSRNNKRTMTCRKWREGDEAEDLTAEEEDDEFHAAMSASDELQLVGPSRKSSDQRVNWKYFRFCLVGK